MINLDGLTMYVSSTATSGVVSGSTRLHFSQRSGRVFARYSGGEVTRGWLVGRWAEGCLRFRYAQREGDRGIHGGSSICEVQRLPNGRTRIIEHFTWSTRHGSGANVFDEVNDAQL